MSAQISSVTQAQPVDQNTATHPKSTESKPVQTPTDTVQVSSAAKAILQEVQENHAQTVQEAASGDSQAKRLLAKEAAAAYVPKQ
jgi:TRAP-type mannitol/chloroaromatic compound transport system substrate-binding protein